MLSNTTMLAMWTPGIYEIAIIGVVALLIFGRRLPEVGRSLGRTIVEFKKGVSEAKKEVDKAATIDERPDSLPKKDSNQAPPTQSSRQEVEKTQ